MEPTMVSRFQGSILGTLIGESMGLPWEMLTRAQILEATAGEGVKGFRDHRPRYFKSVDKLSFPSPSDDYQHTRALARSLIRCGRLDLVDLARELVREYKLSSAGWGGTSEDAMKEFIEWFDSNGERGRDPRVPATCRTDGKGSGNGPSMKIIAYSLFTRLRAERNPLAAGMCVRDEIMRLGLMTHADRRASIASFSLAAITGVCLFYSRFIIRENTGDLVHHLTNLVKDFELQFGDNLCEEELFTTRLEKLRDMDLLFGDPVRLAETIGTSSFSLESIPFSIATFLRHPTDFRAGVLEAINAGGDTDSNAGMVGALIGANVGLLGIPEEWCEFNRESVEAIDLAMELYRVAAGI